MSTKKTKLIERRMGAGGESIYIAGTRVRVHDIVLMIPFVEDDAVVDSIVRSLPHLTTEQVHAAIEYWLTHKLQINRLIEEEEALASTIPIRV